MVLKSRVVDFAAFFLALERFPTGGWGVQKRKCKMSTMFADTLLIVFISVCTALLAEGEGGCFPDALADPQGRDPRPGVSRAPEREVTILACWETHLLQEISGQL